MEYDFTNLVVDQLREADPDFESRREAQADALRELPCINPTVGKWIDTYDVQYLFAAFDLTDEDFAETFPKMADLTQHDRKRILNTFETHIHHCPHCHLKRGFDLELDSRIEKVWRENMPDLIAEMDTEHAEVAPASNVLIHEPGAGK